VDRCSNLRLITRGNRALQIECRQDSKLLTFTADRFVVCAGAIGSSEVLLGSGITQNGRVGRGLHLLGGVVVNAWMPGAIKGFDGIGLTAMVDATADYIIETFSSPPGAFAITTAGWFEHHARQMKHFAGSMQAGVMVGTAPRGTVSVTKAGQCKIDFRFSMEELAALKRGIKQVSRIFLAAGALSISPSTYQPLAIEQEGDIDQLDIAVQEASDLFLGSAHPQGGNAMSEDPKRGVVGPDFRLHGFQNVFVADASVFPSNIWANCQATVMAMAHYASKFIAA
jgi:choline dehydrogenase-like flavoprotein